MRDPAISDLLRACDTAQAVATQIDALAARLLEVAGGVIEPPQPRERYVLAMLGVQG